MSILDSVLRLLEKEEERLDRELSGITAAIAAFGKTYLNGKKARGSSAGGRARIAVPPRVRGAKARKTPKVVSIKAKRTSSVAAGKKVGAPKKARSAKAAKKSA